MPVCAPVLLAADNVAGQTTFLRDIPPGKYADILVRFSGDAAAAQTFAVADLGRIRLSESGRDLVNADADNLRFHSMYEGGSSRVQATAGAQSSVCIRIPRGYGDRNVHQVLESDILQLQMNFGANFTTKFTGVDPAAIKVYGNVRETGEMAYNLLIHQLEENFGAGTFTIPLRRENVIACYVVINANLNRVRLVKDGTEMANVQQGPNAQDNDFNDISDVLGVTDAPDAVAAFAAATGAGAYSSIAKLGIAEEGEIGEFLSDDVQLEFTMAAAQVQEWLVFSADFTPTKLRQTKVETAAVVQRKVARKNTLGRGRPVRTLGIAAE